MKTLLILAVILGILFLYFVVKAEKSFVIKGNEVVPGGIDISKLILGKAAKINSLIVSDKNTKAIGDSVITDSGPALINKIKSNAESIISKTASKVKELIKDPIKNKINEVLCPTK